jgi:hypothetical protein
MDKEEISSNGQGEIKTGIKPAEGSRNNGAQNRPRVKSDTKPRKRKATSKNKLEPAAWSTIAQIGVAIIGLIGTITVAWFSFKSNHPEPAPILILTSTTMPSSTPFFADTSIGLTDRPSPTILPSFTSTTPTTAVPSETITLMPQPKLIVRLEIDRTSGKKPLTVKLDARESYLTDYDGQIYICRNGACYYTWKVYSNGQQIGKSVTDSGGKFDYTFGKQGTYTITVWICRGRDGVDCDGSGTQIIVTK